MRTKVGFALPALLFLTACEEPSAPLFKDAAQRHFAELNATASETRRDVDPPGEGTVRHVYNFDPNAIFVLGAPCTKCGEENDIVDYTGKREARCGKCGEKILDKDMTQTVLEGRFPQKVFPAFKVTQEGKQMKAEVRYVRRVYYWDSRGKIDLPAQKMSELGASTASVRDFAEGVATPGLHRALTAYHGKMEVELRGATAVPISEAREEPLRTWMYALQPYKPTK